MEMCKVEVCLTVLLLVVRLTVTQNITNTTDDASPVTDGSSGPTDLTTTTTTITPVTTDTTGSTATTTTTTTTERSTGATNASTITTTTPPPETTMSTTSTTTLRPNPAFSDCDSCSSLNATSEMGKRYLLLCCRSYSKCCADSSRIQCPSILCDWTTRFCAGDANCGSGTKCCPSSQGTNKCCVIP